VARRNNFYYFSEPLILNFNRKK